MKSSAESNGILIGRRADRWVWTGHQRSALVLGPTRSGKTSSIVIPNILCASGSVVTTSTKPDVLLATSQSRSRVGECFVFDPTGATLDVPNVTPVGWSPLLSARTWDGALEVATSMVLTSQRRSQQGAVNVNHWSERSGALLSTLLHAGALSGDSMETVLQWVDRHHGSDALAILESKGGHGHPATALLAGILATDTREQSGIWSTTSGVLGAYRSIGALESTKGPHLDPTEFVHGNHTLFICASGRTQNLLAPLIVGMLGEIQEAGYRRSDNERPVLFALDELANIAPLPDLPQLVSEGGGQGVLTIGCLQDLSQARLRWGPEANGFLSLFSTTLALGGIADTPTLRALSDLAGERNVPRDSMSIARDRRGGRSSTVTRSHNKERNLRVDEIARGVPGTALFLDSSKRIGRIHLTVAHRDEPWTALIGNRERDLGFDSFAQFAPEDHPTIGTRFRVQPTTSGRER